MADPLSISASVAGLVALALHGARLLFEDVNKIIDAPKSLEDLQSDLTLVKSSLESLEGVDESQLRLLGEPVYNQSKTAIQKCKSVCDGLRADLRRWTKNSGDDGKLSWRDKTNIGFFKERRITAMAKQLQSCKLTLNSVIGTATLYSSIRNAATTKAIEEKLSAKQAEMTAMIATVDTQIDLAECSLSQVHQIEETRMAEQYDGDLESATLAIEEEVAMLQSSQATMRDLVASMQAELAQRAVDRVSNVPTSVSFGPNNSGFQVGTSSGPISGISFGGR